MVLFLKLFFGDIFGGMGEFRPGLQDQLHLLLFFQGKDWLFGCNSYLYHCILCCVCELKQLL